LTKNDIAIEYKIFGDGAVITRRLSQISAIAVQLGMALLQKLYM